MVKCLSFPGWWLSVQFPLPTPYRFHSVVVWRGSSGLGEIREFIRAPFPPGLGSLQVPLREWSASTSGSLCASDLYNLTITHVQNCLESERLVWSRVTSWLSAKLVVPTPLPVTVRRGIDFCFWSSPLAVRHWESPCPIPNLGLVDRSCSITISICQNFTHTLYSHCSLAVFLTMKNNYRYCL